LGSRIRENVVSATVKVTAYRDKAGQGFAAQFKPLAPQAAAK
jgi:hypothetical protein